MEEAPQDERLAALGQATTEAPTAQRPTEEEDAEETIENMLASPNIIDCERGLMMLNCAIYGMPTPFDDFNNALLQTKKRKIGDTIDERLRLVGVADEDGGDALDSRVAACFVHVALRFQRLSRHTRLQVGFLSHLLTSVVGLYSIRSSVIDALYANEVYFTAHAAWVLLSRLDRLEAIEKQIAAAEAKSNANKQRKDATAEDVDMGEVLHERADMQALRKLCIAFLYSTLDSLPAGEAEIIKSQEAGLTEQQIKQFKLIPSIQEYFRVESVSQIVQTVGMSWNNKYATGTSWLVAYIIMPLTILGGAAAISALWSPLLFPEARWLHKHVRVSSDFEWVRYAITAVIVIFMAFLVYTFITQIGGRFIPRKQAAVHAYVAGDSDIRTANQEEATAVPVDMSDIDNIATAEDAPDTAGGAEGEPTRSDAAQASPEDVAAYWSEAMGVSENTAKVMIDAVTQADKLREQSEQGGGDPIDQFMLPVNLLPILETLYVKLEELGEVQIMTQIEDRIRFVRQMYDASPSAQETAAGSGASEE